MECACATDASCRPICWFWRPGIKISRKQRGSTLATKLPTASARSGASTMAANCATCGDAQRNLACGSPQAAWRNAGFSPATWRCRSRRWSWGCCIETPAARSRVSGNPARLSLCIWSWVPAFAGTNGLGCPPIARDPKQRVPAETDAQANCVGPPDTQRHRQEMDGKQAKAQPDQRCEHVRGNARSRATADVRMENDEE